MTRTFAAATYAGFALAALGAVALTAHAALAAIRLWQEIKATDDEIGD